MTELSLHILDIVNNSIKAGAKHIGISVTEDTQSNVLAIQVTDDGCGMDAAFLAQVTDPFKTTRTTRKVGMGISLFKAAAEQTGGSLAIQSELGVGTELTATFVFDSIDRQPVGDMSGTMVTIIGANPDIEYVYTHMRDNEEFRLDTQEIKQILDGVDITSPDVLVWLKDYIREGLADIGAEGR